MKNTECSLSLWIPVDSHRALFVGNATVKGPSHSFQYSAFKFSSLQTKPQVLKTVARSDSARRRSNLMAGHKWKEMVLTVFVIWCNEKCRKMQTLLAILRNEKWEKLSLKQNFISVRYMPKMFFSAYQYCFYCAQIQPAVPSHRTKSS